MANKTLVYLDLSSGEVDVRMTHTRKAWAKVLRRYRNDDAGRIRTVLIGGAWFWPNEEEDEYGPWLGRLVGAKEAKEWRRLEKLENPEGGY